MANEENLKPFNKNDNRASEAGKKSKRLPFDKRMQEWLQEELKDKSGKGTGVSVEEALRLSLLKQGLKGNVAATKEVFNRAYGQSKLPVALSGDDESPAIKVALERRKEITKRLMKSLKLDK